MTWADSHIKKLLNDETVSFRPRGNSMVPRIHSGELCTVKPLDVLDKILLNVDDVVLCTVKGNTYLHKILKTKPLLGGGIIFLIGNNHGRENGWIPTDKIYGKLIKVEK